MEVLTVDNVMNNAVLLLLIIGALVLLAKAKRNNWRRWTDIAFVLFYSVAIMCGEMYSNTYGSIPWLMGAEDDMARRDDLNPVAFLALIAGALFFIGRGLLYKASDIYTNTPWLPGQVTPIGASLSIVLIAGYLCFVGGAYLHHSTGATPGHSAVQAERHIIQSGLNLVGDILSNDKSFGDDERPSNSNTKRRSFWNEYDEPDDDDDNKKPKRKLRFTSPEKKGRMGPDED